MMLSAPFFALSALGGLTLTLARANSGLLRDTRAAAKERMKFESTGRVVFSDDYE